MPSNILEVSKNEDIFLAIDANAIIHRAFHAYPNTLRTSQGIQVDAVFGFTSMLLSVLNKFKPKYIACAFDTAKPTFRHAEYPEYKATRKPKDKSLLAQFPICEEILKAFNIPIIKKEGFEADDILGDISNRVKTGKWSNYGLKLLIVSGDRDLLQLIGDNVEVCLPEGSFRNLVTFNKTKTLEKYGIHPNQIVDYKGIVGDSSDNIPGVKGVGEKTVIELLKKYGSVDQIYNHLDEIPTRQANLLKEGVEQMEMSRKLATIIKDVDIELDLESCVMLDFDRKQVLDLFRELEFRTLINKIPDNGNQDKISGDQMSLFSGSTNEVFQDKNLLYQHIDIPLGGISQIQELFNKEEISKICFVYIPDQVILDKNNLNVSIGNNQANTSDNFLSKNISENLYLLAVDKSGQNIYRKIIINRETSTDQLLSFINTQKCETYFLNWESFCSDILTKNNISFDDICTKCETLRVYDLGLINHVISSETKSNEFEELSFKYLGLNLTLNSQIDEILQAVSKILENISNERYIFNVSMFEEDILDKFQNHRDERIVISKYKYFDRVILLESWLALILAEMEKNGVNIDSKILFKSKDFFENRIKELEKTIYYSIGHEFNISSPKQLSEILFDELKLPMGRGKTGRSTREEVLNKLQGLHPAIESILEYRYISKLNGTYIKPLINNIQNKGLLAQIDDNNNQSNTFKVHTDYIQTGTTSGRLSSQEPNMQNLPTGDLNADIVKSIYVPTQGYTFLSLDYSQIELRVLAAISKDENMIKDFNNDRDIHTATASRVLDKPLKDVSKKDRSLGKTINFGIVYGQTKYGLARMLNISGDLAEKYIDEYFEEYKGVKSYMEYVKDFCTKNGYVETLLGRRRFIRGINSPNIREREASVREAINMPIQGSAADIIKLAMFDISQYIVKNGLSNDVKLLLQVHDELIFEIKDELMEKVAPELEKIFGSVLDLGIPLVVHKSVGNNLSELK